MEYLLGYIAFVFCFFLVGNLILFVLEKLIVFSFDQIKEFLYPSQKLTEEQINEIRKKAADFVHSKHRPWDYDDGFAEYLWICNELGKDRNYLKKMNVALL